MRRTALLLTGENRTIVQTWRSILENIIVPSNCDVFVHWECSNHGHAYVNNNSENNNNDVIVNRVERELRQWWGNHVVAIKHITSDEKAAYILARDEKIETQPALQQSVFDRTGINRNYLKNSGTLIEYYQIQACAEMMVAHERKMESKYEFVIRSRLDATLTQPLRVPDWFQFSSSVIDNSVTSLMRDGDGDGDGVCNFVQKHDLAMSVARVIASIGCHTRLEDAVNINLVTKVANDTKFLSEELFTKETLSDFMCHCLNTYRLVWTWRKNMCWICTRSVADNVFNIWDTYGEYDETNDPYAFNSETCFEQHLRHRDIMQLDHWSAEDESHLSYRHKNIKILQKRLHDDEEDDNSYIISDKIPSSVSFVVIRKQEYRFDYK